MRLSKISARQWQITILCHNCVKEYPCKIRTGILVGSRRDLGGNRSRWDFGRQDFSSRRESRWETKILAAKISLGSYRESYQDSRREAIIPAAKISPECYRESRQDSRREVNSWWQKSRRDLAGNLTKIGDGKQNSWWDSLWESRQNFRHAATNFF